MFGRDVTLFNMVKVPFPAFQELPDGDGYERHGVLQARSNSTASSRTPTNNTIRSVYFTGSLLVRMKNSSISLIACKRTM